MVISTEAELKRAYQGDDTAARYVAVRFQSEVTRLLHDRQVAAVQRLLDQVGSGSALEIAPGPGRLTRDLRPHGSLVCLEFNEGMIVHGRATSPPGARWVRGDAFRLPFGPAFDLVYSLRFVRHFRLDDRRRLYAEVQRVLRPGGTFLFDAVNERISRPLREAAPHEYPIYDELYRADELRAELLAAGFESLELTAVQRWHRWQGFSQTLIGPRCNWLNRLVVRGLERLPAADGLEWIVTCRRA